MSSISMSDPTEKEAFCSAILQIKNGVVDSNFKLLSMKENCFANEKMSSEDMQVYEELAREAILENKNYLTIPDLRDIEKYIDSERILKLISEIKDSRLNG